LSVRRTVFEISHFKNAATLKNGLGSVKVTGNGTIRQRIWLPTDVL